MVRCSTGVLWIQEIPSTNSLTRELQKRAEGDEIIMVTRNPAS
jgi:hypothetical protein